MQNNILVVIPLYNHALTVAEVIKGVLALEPEFSLHVLVVDDGSTDGGSKAVEEIQKELNILASPEDLDNEKIYRLNLIRHEKNRGKGKAILSAVAWAAQNFFSHIITIDADTQHNPKELPKFIEAIKSEPKAIWVGERDFSVPNVPASSKFGRSFSAFWMRVQTGKAAPDMQSGFRAYPVELIQSLCFSQSRYSFEVEVIVKAAWAGFDIKSIPISVFYPPVAERVSHFKKFYDNLLISILNTKLTMRALIPLPFNQCCYTREGRISVRHPLNALRFLLAEANTPFILALSTFIAVLISMLPIIGLQSIALLWLMGYLKLNRVWALTVFYAFWPPIVFGINIEAGHFFTHGTFLTEISWVTLGKEWLQRAWEWLVGSLLFGPILAVALAMLVYILSCWIRKGLRVASK